MQRGESASLTGQGVLQISCAQFKKNKKHKHQTPFTAKQSLALTR